MRSPESPGGAIRHLRTFFDSNILLYCDDAANPAKQLRAVELVLEHQRRNTGVVSLQVLQEYFVNSTRKLRVEAALARQKVEVYTRFHVVEPSVSDILAAIDLHRLRGFSYWDALILRCARQAGCSVLLTEDMQHGQVIEGVRIVNPFI
jgi:predicted nucleic acid-binding protein